MNVSEHRRPRVTVITVVYNGARHIERAIRSVLAQDYPSIEYIIIDGGSTDGTVEIIRKYQGHLAFWLSEPDRGAADAQNKAVRLATGEFVAWCMADDWLEFDFISRSIAAIEASGAEFSFGDMVFQIEGKPVYVVDGDATYGRWIRFMMPRVNYPTTVVRKAAFDHIGLFDASLKVAPDYDWMLRLHLSGARGTYDKRIRCNFSLGGNSQTNKMRGYVESVRIAWRHGPFWVGFASLAIHFVYAAHHLLWNRWGPGSARIRAERRQRRDLAREVAK